MSIGLQHPDGQRQVILAREVVVDLDEAYLGILTHASGHYRLTSRGIVAGLGVDRRFMVQDRATDAIVSMGTRYRWRSHPTRLLAASEPPRILSGHPSRARLPDEIGEHRRCVPNRSYGYRGSRTCPKPTAQWQRIRFPPATPCGLHPMALSHSQSVPLGVTD